MTDIKTLNKLIKSKICTETINKLSDENLSEEYKKCKSVRDNIEELSKILQECKIDKLITELVMTKYFKKMISPGTKGVIRGNFFNKIVKTKIDSLNLDSERFKIEYEKNYEKINISEKPDFYIFDRITDKVIIGMNQLDLWNGGQQLNRGYKYIINNIYNTEKSKLLCVICNDCEIKNKNNKVFKLFDTGFSHNTLCYVNGIEKIILEYFF